MRKEPIRKLQREYIEQNPSVAKIKTAIAGNRRMGSFQTVEHYVTGVIRFVNFVKQSNAETTLQAIHKGELDAGAKVDEFIDYALDELGNSHATVKTYTSGVKKWFDLNDVKVNWDKIEMPTATATVEEDRAPTKDELKTLLSSAVRSRDRFVITALSSSGLRIGTLISLKVGNVDFKTYPDVAVVKVENGKGRKFSVKRGVSSGKLYFTFFSPEAKTELKNYIAERENKGEKITSESPLVTNYNYKGEFITVEAYEKVWNRLLKKVGINQKGNKYHKLHLHTLRKYFRSNCVGVDASFRERWMGHKGLYLDESYFRAEESLHLMEYRKAIPHLTIYSEPTQEKRLRSQMLLDFAKLQGYEPEQLKKLEDVLARSKDVNEAIEEFRKFKDDSNTAQPSKAGKHVIAKGESDLIRKLDDGWDLVQSLNEDRFLLYRN
jgi:integrase